MELGIDSFAAAYDDASLAISPANRLRQLIEQIELADQVGLDAFGIGEHHRQEYLDSAPAVILAGAATRTSRIRLTSAVAVLSAVSARQASPALAHLATARARNGTALSLNRAVKNRVASCSRITSTACEPAPPVSGGVLTSMVPVERLKPLPTAVLVEVVTMAAVFEPVRMSIAPA